MKRSKKKKSTQTKQRNQSVENKNQAFKRKGHLITAIWLRKSHACSLMQAMYSV